jgi:hypothetical protein
MELGPKGRKADRPPEPAASSSEAIGQQKHEESQAARTRCARRLRAKTKAPHLALAEASA